MEDLNRFRELKKMRRFEFFNKDITHLIYDFIDEFEFKCEYDLVIHELKTLLELEYWVKSHYVSYIMDGIGYYDTLNYHHHTIPWESLNNAKTSNFRNDEARSKLVHLQRSKSNPKNAEIYEMYNRVKNEYLNKLRQRLREEQPELFRYAYRRWLIHIIWDSLPYILCMLHCDRHGVVFEQQFLIQ